MSVKLKDYLRNPEGLFNEYKEFSLSEESTRDISNIDLNRYINGDYDERLEKLVYDNLSEYLDKYFPKCLTAFINTYNTLGDISNITKAHDNMYYDSMDVDLNNEMFYGSLTIGVTDSGCISGIPFPSHYSGDHIRNIIKNKICRLIQTNIIIKNMDDDDNDDGKLNEYYKNLIYDKVKINVIPLINTDKNNVGMDNHVQKIIDDDEKYFSENFTEDVEKEINMFQHYYSQWLDAVNRYQKKLINMMSDDDIHSEFIEYINKDCKYHSFDVVVKPDYPDEHSHQYHVTENKKSYVPRKPMTDHIHENYYVYIQDGDKYIKLKYKLYKLLVEKFKKKMYAKVYCRKPQRPTCMNKKNKRSYKIYPKQILIMRLTSLIDKFSINNSASYFMIKISIPLLELERYVYVGYIDDKQKYIFKRRKIAYINLSKIGIGNIMTQKNIKKACNFVDDDKIFGIHTPITENIDVLVKNVK